jgi:Uma2 family endonuclease
MVVPPKRAPTRMTVDEFLVWNAADASGRRWQLIEGEPVLMAPAPEPHGEIQAEIGRVLRNHLVERKSPCRVLPAPGIVPMVRANENFRIPDLGVTRAPVSREIRVPDSILLIEILSPSNESETRSSVWTYTTIPSVQEVLIVHSTRIEAELLRRGEDGTWPHQATIIRSNETLNLASVDFNMPLSALYRTSGLRPE